MVLCAKFGSNGRSSSGEDVENVIEKFSDGQTDRQTEDRQNVIGKAQVS